MSVFDGSALREALLIIAAVAVWQTARSEPAEIPCSSFSDTDPVEILLSTAECYLDSGFFERSADVLDLVRDKLAQRSDLSTYVSISHDVSLAIQHNGNRDESLARLDDTIALVSDSELLAAPLFNSVGNLYVAAGDYFQAIASYEDSLRLAAPRDRSLRAVAQLNKARAVHAVSADQMRPNWLHNVGDDISMVADDAQRATYLLMLGDLFEKLSIPRLADAEIAYKSALGLLESRDDSEALAYARGYLGRIAAERKDVDDAKRYTQGAILAAHRSNASSQYFWEWQMARLLLDDGARSRAIDMYSNALDNLDAIRSTFWGTHATEFERIVRPVYYELAEILIGAPGVDTPAVDLEKARSVLERGKLAEVENHFRDECANVATTARSLEALGNDVAVLYPVPFDDRLELLLSIDGVTKRYTVPVGSQTLSRTVDQLRLSIQFLSPSGDLLGPSQQLYRWLIAPLAEELEHRGTKTLVFVPDRHLRGLPIAALHDGTNYLIESLSLAITPGLTLLDPKPLAGNTRVVASGISEPVLGFEALPSVPDELARIGQSFPVTSNVNRQFNEASLIATIADRQHTVVHIATHAEISANHEASYLVMYDDVLPMSRLEEIVSARKYLGEPIELLVLSACETAVGDDQAALGLAGIAVQAGARSAVASLWRLSDEATSVLMGDFYAALKSDGMSKADALRSAQRRMSAGEHFSHPAYWSSFVLIGNWL